MPNDRTNCRHPAASVYTRPAATSTCTAYPYYTAARHHRVRSDDNNKPRKSTYEALLAVYNVFVYSRLCDEI